MDPPGEDGPNESRAMNHYGEIHVSDNARAQLGDVHNEVNLNIDGPVHVHVHPSLDILSALEGVARYSNLSSSLLACHERLQSNEPSRSRDSTGWLSKLLDELPSILLRLRSRPFNSDIVSIDLSAGQVSTVAIEAPCRASDCNRLHSS